MPTTDRKTSLILTAASLQAYQMAKAMSPDLTLQEFVNIAIASYHKQRNGGNMDAVITHVKILKASVDALVARPVVSFDQDAFVAAFLQALSARDRPSPMPISTPTPRPKWRQWLDSWRKPAQELHW